MIIKEDVDEGSISWGKLGILVEVMYLIEVNLIISLISMMVDYQLDLCYTEGTVVNVKMFY
jgi:hypothetical protein